MSTVKWVLYKRRGLLYVSNITDNIEHSCTARLENNRIEEVVEFDILTPLLGTIAWILDNNGVIMGQFETVGKPPPLKILDMSKTKFPELFI